jgi:hypothetical protein
VIERFAHNLDQLRAILGALTQQRQAVFVTSRVLERSPWKEFFADYSLKKIAAEANGFTLYRLGSYDGDHEKKHPDRTS